MRKRTVNHVVDKCFWSLVLILPLILLAIIWCKNGDTTYTLSSCLSMFGVSTTNPIYATFVGMFGSSGTVFELFTATDLYLYFTYMVGVELLHLLVDFLLFLPRWCQKVIHYGGEE